MSELQSGRYHYSKSSALFINRLTVGFLVGLAVCCIAVFLLSASEKSMFDVLIVTVFLSVLGWLMRECVVSIGFLPHLTERLTISGHTVDIETAQEVLHGELGSTQSAVSRIPFLPGALVLTATVNGRAHPIDTRYLKLANEEPEN